MHGLNSILETGNDIIKSRISQALQWFRLSNSIAGGIGLIPGQGTKIPHAVWHGQKKKKVNLKIHKWKLSNMMNSKKELERNKRASISYRTISKVLTC